MIDEKMHPNKLIITKVLHQYFLNDSISLQKINFNPKVVLKTKKTQEIETYEYFQQIRKYRDKINVQKNQTHFDLAKYWLTFFKNFQEKIVILEKKDKKNVFNKLGIKNSSQIVEFYLCKNDNQLIKLILAYILEMVTDFVFSWTEKQTFLDVDNQSFLKIRNCISKILPINEKFLHDYHSASCLYLSNLQMNPFILFQIARKKEIVDIIFFSEFPKRFILNLGNRWIKFYFPEIFEFLTQNYQTIRKFGYLILRLMESRSLKSKFKKRLLQIPKNEDIHENKSHLKNSYSFFKFLYSKKCRFIFTKSQIQRKKLFLKSLQDEPNIDKYFLILSDFRILKKNQCKFLAFYFYSFKKPQTYKSQILKCMLQRIIGRKTFISNELYFIKNLSVKIHSSIIQGSRKILSYFFEKLFIFSLDKPPALNFIATKDRKKIQKYKILSKKENKTPNKYEIKENEVNRSKRINYSFDSELTLIIKDEKNAIKYDSRYLIEKTIRNINPPQTYFIKSEILLLPQKLFPFHINFKISKKLCDFENKILNVLHKNFIHRKIMISHEYSTIIVILNNSLIRINFLVYTVLDYLFEYDELILENFVKDYGLIYYEIIEKMIQKNMIIKNENSCILNSEFSTHNFDILLNDYKIDTIENLF